jgi:hypothetical protein
MCLSMVSPSESWTIQASRSSRTLRSLWRTSGFVFAGDVEFVPVGVFVLPDDAATATLVDGALAFRLPFGLYPPINC